MSESINYQEMTKSQLIDHINNLNDQIVNLKKSRQRSGSRKFEVLEILSHGPMSILDIANQLGITSKNVSSLLCYLKKDGFGLIVNEEGQRVLTKHNGEDINEEYIKNYIDSHKKPDEEEVSE